MEKTFEISHMGRLIAKVVTSDSEEARELRDAILKRQPYDKFLRAMLRLPALDDIAQGEVWELFSRCLGSFILNNHKVPADGDLFWVALDGKTGITVEVLPMKYFKWCDLDAVESDSSGSGGSQRKAAKAQS